MTKHFRTAPVLSVVTGRLLSKFEDMHALMDHLYPGIMTIGVAAMQEIAAHELVRQHQVLRSWRVCPNRWREWLDVALAELPPKLAIEGPHDVSDAEVKAAFERFTRGEGT